MTKKVVGTNTEKEIFGQPELWAAVYQLILDKSPEIKKFLNPLLKRPGLRIVLTGAGSSAFVGEAAQGPVQQSLGVPCRAIPTTDLVTHPGHYFSLPHPILIVSFARSGNSPESLQTIRLAKKYCREFYHLVITCNKAGQLLKICRPDTIRTYCLVLPEEANDKSLAMTGSYTSMLLSILLLADLPNIRHNERYLACLLRQGVGILDRHRAFHQLGEVPYERVVFLGSGPMVGIARECQLKVQELTNGKIISKYDSFLGFRHGPRVVADARTLLVYFFSEDQHVFRYERDLVLELMKSTELMGTIHIGKRVAGDPSERLSIIFDPGTEGYNIVPATLTGQLLGYYKSLALGLDPDNPSTSGAISRVVQGVILYGTDHSHNDL